MTKSGGGGERQTPPTPEGTEPGALSGHVCPVIYEEGERARTIVP